MTYTQSYITAIVPCSPIPSNPDTTILDTTIASIAQHLPNSRIIMTMDGVRAEQEHRRADYEEFISRIEAKLGSSIYKNAEIMLFDKHTHQVGMARAALRRIATPLIMYAEQDVALCPDYVIDFDALSRPILEGHLNVLRLHFEAVIPDAHKHMMLDQSPIDMDNVPVIRTFQWSQRIHLAYTLWYENMLNERFSEDANCFIEDYVAGFLVKDYVNYGIDGWNRWKVGIYAPSDHYKRCYHLDGRAGDDKFDNMQKG